MKDRALCRKIAVCLAAVLLVMAGIVCSAGTGYSYAADEYTYTVRIFAGNQGTIDGNDVKVYTGLKAGQKVSFSASSVELKDSKYYVSGIRKSGADNYDPDDPQTSVITVTGDEDYVVAYGILGKSVKYTVRYLDEDGGKLAESKTFYGNVGDKPMVAFEYIEGYYPQAYNLTKTLSSDASKNVFDFTYTSTEDTETVITQVQQGVTATGGAAGTGAGTGDGTGDGAADGTTIGDNATPQAGPSDVVDLDDNDTPQAAPKGVEEDSKRGISPLGIAGIAVGAAAIAAAVYALIRRRNAYEYEDDEDE